MSKIVKGNYIIMIHKWNPVPSLVVLFILLVIKGSRYCSRECRDTTKAWVERQISGYKKPKIPSVQDKYNHDYRFAFSSGMKDQLTCIQWHEKCDKGLNKREKMIQF